MRENYVDGDIIWFRQTIKNASGTMGVIHSVFNGDVPSYLRISFLKILTNYRTKHTSCKYS